MSENTFHRLPEELITLLGSFIELGDLLSFALTSKQNHRCVSGRLALQSTYQEQYTVQHDRQPLTMLELLRRATSGKEDTDPLWHVRALEFWDGRLSWENWKTTSFPNHYEEGEDETDESEENWYKLDPAQDLTHYTAECFKTDELKLYRSIFQDGLRLTLDETETWAQMIESGGDEPLKALLVSQLPNLKTLTMFANAEYQDAEPAHPLTILSLSINHLIASTTPAKIPWPPGLASLTTISVSKFLDGDYEDFRHPHDAYYCPFSAIKPLFRLPNIKTLHISVAGYIEDEEEGAEKTTPTCDLPQGCSSVENLTFYACDLDYDQLKTLIFSACNLKTLTTDKHALEKLRNEVKKGYPECTIVQAD